MIERGERQAPLIAGPDAACAGVRSSKGGSLRFLHRFGRSDEARFLQLGFGDDAAGMDVDNTLDYVAVEVGWPEGSGFTIWKPRAEVERFVRSYMAKTFGQDRAAKCSSMELLHLSIQPVKTLLRSAMQIGEE